MILSSMNRRKFIAGMLKSVASLLTFYPFSKIVNASPLTLDPRQRIPNPFTTPDGRPLLICVNGDNYGQMLQTGLATLGGLQLLINNNQAVLIKPNCVYTEEYPTTSDIDSVVSTIEAVQAVSSGNVNVGDGGAINNEQIYDFLGIEEAVFNAGANLILFEDTYNVRRNTWPQEIPDFEVWSDLYDSPVLINLCALKRHYAAFMTCAIKHHIGAVAGPNRQDTRGYLHNFDDQSYEFLTTIAEIAGLVNPELTIVDARQIMAINGPLRSYGGEIRDCGKIIISGDMVAADAYCAGVMDEYDETFDANWINDTLQRAVDLNLGIADLEQVEVIELDQTTVDDFTDQSLPSRVKLHQNYPNPFNASTHIRFDLPSREHVKIEVFDILGRKVTTLTDAVYEKGSHQVSFNASNLSSGTYYYRLTTSVIAERKALVLTK